MNSYLYKDINIGDKVEFKYDLTKEKMQEFLNITGDINPLHNNIDYAKEKGYKDVVVYGLLTSSALSTLAGVYMPGKYSLIHSIECNYIAPVFLSDMPLKVMAEVIEKDDRFSRITIKYKIFNSRYEKVSRGTMKIGVTK